MADFVRRHYQEATMQNADRLAAPEAVKPRVTLQAEFHVLRIQEGISEGLSCIFHESGAITSTKLLYGINPCRYPVKMHRNCSKRFLAQFILELSDLIAEIIQIVIAENRGEARF